MSLGDQSKDGYLSFDEFLNYMSDHEKKLWLVFKSIDVDDNGKMFINSSRGTVFGRGKVLVHMCAWYNLHQ